MRWVVALTMMLLVGAGLRGDDAEDARKIIDKAISAAGGSKNLAKFNACTWNGKGTFHGMGQAIPYTGTWTRDLPGRYRMEVDNAFTIVVSDNKGWMIAGGMTMELMPDQIADQREANHSGWVSSLLPLTNKAFTLATLPERDVSGAKAVGVKVSHAGRRDVHLYFEKTGGLLVKTEHTAKEDDGTNVQQETFITAYTTVSDAKMPRRMRIMRAGKIYVEAEMTDYRPIDPKNTKAFEKP